MNCVVVFEVLLCYSAPSHFRSHTEAHKWLRLACTNITTLFVEHFSSMEQTQLLQLHCTQDIEDLHTYNFCWTYRNRHSGKSVFQSEALLQEEKNICSFTVLRNLLRNIVTSSQPTCHHKQISTKCCPVLVH